MVMQNNWNNTLIPGLKVKFGNDTQGDIYYLNSSLELVRLGVGTSGQAIISNGTIPVWGNPSPSGNASGDLSGTYPAPTIANNVVTFPKMQNVPTDTFLGRITAATGSIETISVSQAQTMLGLGTAAYLTSGTAAGNIPVLDGTGKLDSGILPNIAISTITVVANQAARLALTDVHIGDVAKQTDNGSSYILSVLPASVDANWISISDTTIDGSEITTGVVSPARLGTGTPDNIKYLRGDGVWATIGASSQIWVNVSGNGALTLNAGHFIDSASLVSLSIPTATPGTIIDVVGVSSGGYRFIQSADQQIIYLDKATTLGVTGKMETEISITNSSRATVRLVAQNANIWYVFYATGTFDIS